MGLKILCEIFFTFRLNVKNIRHNTVSPAEHCYDSEYNYGDMFHFHNGKNLALKYVMKVDWSIVDSGEKEKKKRGYKYLLQWL